MFKRFLILMVAMVTFALPANATHIVGGEIFYECLGGNEYLITLKIYRDCLNGQAPFDDPATISIYDNSGVHVTDLFANFNGSDILDVVINNPCLQVPPDICVEEAVYSITVQLPVIPGGYHVAYQRCCRNESVINIIDPGAQGSTYYVQIPEVALNTCNSSPYFSNFPPLALCIGDELVFDHSATDPEGDQLVYSLCTPYHGGSQAIPAPNPADPPPYADINWSSGFSSSYPLDAGPQLAIDPTTGQLTGTPTQEGQYVVGVCVEEFRNGQLMSTNSRDFQFSVVSCSSNVQAVIPAQQVFHEPCEGLEVQFANQSINAQHYHWDFGVNFLTDDVSDLEIPTYIYPDTGTYTVTLIANPSYPCADTTAHQILIYAAVTADIDAHGEQCFDVNSFDFEANGQFGNGATFHWQFESAQPSSSTEMNPSGITFNSIGNSDVTLTISENVCSDQAQIQITTHPRPEAYFNPEPFVGCIPLTISLIDSSFSSTPHEVLWDFGNGVVSSQHNPGHTYNEAGIYDLSVSIWTNQGCIGEAEMTLPGAVTVHPLPTGTLSVEPDTQSIFEPHFQFTGTSEDAQQCLLILGTSDTLWASMEGCSFAYTYSDTGNYHAQMVFIDNNGCMIADTRVIRVQPEVRFWLPNAFTPDGDGLNDTWGASAMGWRQFELWVLDRWGQVVFHTTDPDHWWNGNMNNRSNHEPMLGVYTYRIVAHSVKNDVVRQVGIVTIAK